MRTGVQKAQVVGKERLQDRDTLHLKGEVSGAKLYPFISTVKPDAMYPVDLWIDEKTAIPVQLHVTEPDNNGWQIELFGINDPVDIPTPQLPPPLLSLKPECRERSGTRTSILALVCLPVFIGALDLTIVSAVLPEVISVAGHRDPEARRRRLGRDRLLRVVRGQHDVHGEGVGYRRPPPRVSRLPGDLLLRLLVRGRLAGLACPPHAARDGAVPGTSRPKLRRALRADCRPRGPGVRCRRDGAREHGARRRPVSAREAGASARHRRRGRHGGLGARPLLRRHHGAVHELAVPVLDQPSDRLRDRSA